eukprot:6204218-Pleurochrysis_carterae.AAC.1
MSHRRNTFVCEASTRAAYHVPAQSPNVVTLQRDYTAMFMSRCKDANNSQERNGYPAAFPFLGLDGDLIVRFHHY